MLEAEQKKFMLMMLVVVSISLLGLLARWQAGNVLLLYTYFSDRRRGGQREDHSSTYNKTWWTINVPNFRQAKFIRTFRVSKGVFKALVAKAMLAKDFEVSGAKANVATPPDMQIAMFLYKNGRPISYFDVAERFGVSEGHCFQCVRRVLHFINTEFKVRARPEDTVDMSSFSSFRLDNATFVL